jgi:betaine-homocysteine S-methyltransferase
MGLLERLADGPLICAEGYLFELERRGYVRAGPFVPEVVLEAPEAVAALHHEYVQAGSDVVEAFTYDAHRAKLRAIGREKDLERLNRKALEIAKGVASETGALFAGNICNSHVFEPDDRTTHAVTQAMFQEQLEWALDAGVEFVIAETFPFYEEALLALKEVKAAGLLCVVTLAILGSPETFDGVPAAEACKRLAAAGADVVGLNCMRGPSTMLPLIEQIVPVVDIPVAALPVPYRTTEAAPSFVTLNDPDYPCPPSGRTFPTALDPMACNRYEIADFTRNAAELGVRYFGLCCGAAPHYVRSMAEALGRTPPASRFSPNINEHALLGEADSADLYASWGPEGA